MGWLFALDIRSDESPLPDGRGSAWGRDVLPNRDRQGAAATFITFGGTQAHVNSIEDAAVGPGTSRSVRRRKS